MTTQSGPALPTLPAVELLMAPRVTLEVIAIAAAVFALVLSLLWLYVPSEAIWFLVLGLAVNRRSLRNEGLDIVFEGRSRSRSNVARGAVVVSAIDGIPTGR